MECLVTGGGGFIGSHLCERFLEKREVVCSLTGSQKGMACVEVDGEQYFLRHGESTFIRAGVKHRLSNTGKVGLEIIEVQLGEYLGEDYIVGFDDEYGREYVLKLQRDSKNIEKSILCLTGWWKT